MGLSQKIAVATLLPERFRNALPNSGQPVGIGDESVVRFSSRGFPKETRSGVAWNAMISTRVAAALRTLDSDPQNSSKRRWPKLRTTEFTQEDGPPPLGHGIAVGQCVISTVSIFWRRPMPSRAKMTSRRISRHPHRRHESKPALRLCHGPIFLKASAAASAHPDPRSSSSE